MTLLAMMMLGTPNSCDNKKKSCESFNNSVMIVARLRVKKRKKTMTTGAVIIVATIRL